MTAYNYTVYDIKCLWRNDSSEYSEGLPRDGQSLWFSSSILPPPGSWRKCYPCQVMKIPTLSPPSPHLCFPLFYANFMLIPPFPARTQSSPVVIHIRFRCWHAKLMTGEIMNGNMKNSCWNVRSYKQEIFKTHHINPWRLQRFLISWGKKVNCLWGGNEVQTPALMFFLIISLLFYVSISSHRCIVTKRKHNPTLNTQCISEWLTCKPFHF